MAEEVITVEGLDERHPGVTPAIAGTFSEAASVCLSRHHSPPSDLRIHWREKNANTQQTIRKIVWTVPSSRVLGAHANSIDTTENGGYGVCLATVDSLKNLVAVRRAETLTGADYYIAPIGTPVDDLESWLRLEISGISAGDDKKIHQRLAIKIKQARDGVSNLPAVAGVVGFQQLLVALEEVDLNDLA